MKRSTFVTNSAAVLASIAFVRGPVKAADFAYKLGTDVPVNHPLNVHLRLAADAIRHETNGRLDITLFPNNQLGGASAMITQLRTGAIQMQAAAGPNFGTVVEAASIEGVGYAFPDAAHALQAFDGDLGAYVRKEFVAKGLRAFEKKMDNGVRQVTSSLKPIHTADDIVGLKVRTPPGKLWIDLFKALGASPTPLDFNEVYSGLQTHVIDGQENPYVVIEVARLFEVQKYLCVTNHMWTGYWIVTNGGAWDALPRDVQAIADKHMNRQAMLQRRDNALVNASTAEKLRRLGMQIVTTDPASFRAKLGGFYKQSKSDFGAAAWDLLEKSTGKLA